MDKNGKFVKKLLLKNYLPFLLMSCNSNWANYAQAWGFCSLFRPRSQSFALKSCPQGRDFDEESSGPGAVVGMGGW